MNLKPKMMPVIIGATGTISESLRQYLSNITGEHEIKELKKKADILGTARTSQSSNVKVHNAFHVINNITCSRNCKYRAAATLYTIETCFFRYVIVNTLHKMITSVIIKMIIIHYYYYYLFILKS
jgi:hypothetical protein